MGQKDRLLGLEENVIIGELIPAGTGLPSRREQLDWMPKARALAAMFGTDEEEELPTLRPEARGHRRRRVDRRRIAKLIRSDGSIDNSSGSTRLQQRFASTFATA